MRLINALLEQMDGTLRVNRRSQGASFTERARQLPQSRGPLSHHSEIVLGVLIEVFCLDGIAVRHSFSRQRHVALIVSMRVPG